MSERGSGQVDDFGEAWEHDRLDARLIRGVWAQGACDPFIEARDGLQLGDLLRQVHPQLTRSGAYFIYQLSAPVDEGDHVLEVVAAQEIVLATASKRLEPSQVLDIRPNGPTSRPDSFGRSPSLLCC